MDHCPACLRGFEDFRKYHKVFVHEANLVRAANVLGVITKHNGGSHIYSDQIRDLLENDPWVKKYFNALEGLVGTEASPDQLIPDWSPDFRTGLYHLIPGTAGYYVERGEVKGPKVTPNPVLRLHLAIKEGLYPVRENGHRVATITLAKVPNIGTPSDLFVAGRVIYKGRSAPPVGKSS